ncbi:MAG: ATP-grasp domain-containing protein [Candidatus Nitrosotenuis sp.]|nr:ATP-grasp domain-containing protein [Candidatus Nitrosotenuis sp.]
MRQANVLVTGAGSILGQGIIKSLKLSNVQHPRPVAYNILAADMSPQAAGIYRCSKAFLISAPSEPDYGDRIVQICRENGVDAVFAGTDEELLPLALLKDRIKKESGATVITNPVDVIMMASDKWATYEYLTKNRLSCAQSSLPESKDEFVGKFGYPIVVKPRQGYGSLHFYVVHNNDELQRAISTIEAAGWQPILQEYLGGTDNEFTSGITVDVNGAAVMSSISMKKTLKNGQTYKAFIDDFDSVRSSAREVALKVGAVGPVNVQAKLVDGDPTVFEINARFSATCPIRAAAGINEPDIVFRNMVMGEKIHLHSYLKMVCMRYWSEVYVPMSTYEQVCSVKSIQNPDSKVLSYF